MAKKQNNMAFFERAGYALGASKSTATGFNYVKGIAVAMEDMDRIDASIKKTQDLMKKNPNGQFDKLSQSTFPKVSEYILGVKNSSEFKKASRDAQTGTDEEKLAANEFLNKFDANVSRLDKDLEGAALQRQEAFDLEAGNATHMVDGVEKISTYAKGNNSYQLANHQALINGDMDAGAVIQEDENGDVRYMVQGIVDGQPTYVPYDELDTGDSYNGQLESDIDTILNNSSMLFNAVNENGMPSTKDKMSEDAYNNIYRPKIKKQFEDILNQPGGKQAIKNYMNNDERLVSAFISNQVGIPQMIDGKPNPKWEAFLNNTMSPAEKRNMPASYDDFVNNNKFNSDFSDGFIDSVLGMLDSNFTSAQEQGDGITLNLMDDNG